MSEVPFLFLTIPLHIYQSDWLDPLDDSYAKKCRFLMWACSKCRNYSTEHLQGCHLLTLESYEFIFQGNLSSLEMGNSRQETRTIIDQLMTLKFIEETSNSQKNQFTCYKFTSKNELSAKQKRINQPSNQPSNQPTNQPKTRSKYRENNKIKNIQPTYQPTYQPTVQPTDPISHIIRNRTIEHRIIEDENEASPVPLSSLKNLVINNSSLRGSFNDNQPDNYKKISEYQFPDKSKIKQKTLVSWFGKYDPIEILESIEYYEKMRKHQKIPKPEAYLQKCLDGRFWEKEKFREEIRKKENHKEN